jgi:hypothetical protein
MQKLSPTVYISCVWKEPNIIAFILLFSFVLDRISNIRHSCTLITVDKNILPMPLCQMEKGVNKLATVN